MSIKVQLATFSKRENSTATYSGTWTDYDCLLKDNCSVMRPQIELHTATNISGFNYAHISAFNRYYFITDISYYREMIVVSMTCDVLATYKSQISSASEYILRSASDYSGEIVDNLYPMIGTVNNIVGDYTPTAPFTDSDITYIVGLMNNNSTHKFGAVQYYAINSTSLGSLLSYLMGASTGGTDIFTDLLNIMSPITDQDIRNGITRSLINPSQYIVESFALPYKPPIASSGQTLKAGWYTLPAGNGDIINNTATQFYLNTVTLSVPSHPDASTRGRYLNLEPFTKYWLYLGSFGTYPLDSSVVFDAQTITCVLYGDLMGNITCSIYVDSCLIDILHANVKCNFPVGQVTMDVARGASNVIGGAQGIARTALGDPTGIVSGVSGIISAADAMLPQARSQSAQGTFVNVFDKYYIFATCHDVVDEDVTHRGKPLCEQRTISTLSGYILVSDADISIPGTKEENQQVKNYMNSGFYYE